MIEFDPREQSDGSQSDNDGECKQAEDYDDFFEEQDVVHPINNAIRVYKPEFFADCEEFRLKPHNIGEFLENEEKL